MADAKRVERPLSPHLTVYRPQLTSVTSILTRITGNAMIVTALLIVWWLAAAAAGPDYFAAVNGFATGFIGDVLFSLSLLGIWYHYLAGLRHLIYDAGRGLDIPTAEKLGWACIIGSVVLTVLTMIIV
ncbi:succinate dehydrogenase, cytochrome b556 subunit [Shimia sp. W99]